LSRCKPVSIPNKELISKPEIEDKLNFARFIKIRIKKCIYNKKPLDLKTYRT
jgi:hypothetical protein